LRPGVEGKQLLFQIVLTIGFFLSIVFMPLAGIFSGLLTPAPSAIAVLRRGFPGAWLVPGCSAVIGSVILYLLNLSDTIPCMLAFIGMGALMGYGLRSRWSTERIIGYSSLLIIGMAGVVLIVIFAGTKGDVVGLLEKAMREAISAAFKQMGGATVEYQEMESSILETVPTIVRMMPGVLVSSALGVSLLNLLVSRRYCRVAAVEYCVQEELTLWKSPEYLVWLVIASGLMMLLPIEDLKVLGLNLLIVTGTIYFFQGLAIVGFYLVKWKLPFFVKGLVYTVLFLQQFASMAAAVLGLFDVWFDFRRLTKKPA
jgi:uncharacterized protein YybS (DUF2232 family)